MEKMLKKQARSRTLKKIKKYRILYLFILPLAAAVIVFNYLPMYGILLAFKNFRYSRGIWGSEWADPLWKYFKQFFDYYFFSDIMKNTISISLIKISTSFVCSVGLALVINELVHLKFKKFIQTSIYLPHFMSWAIVASFIGRFLSIDYGLPNQVLSLFGKEPILWLGEPKYFYLIIALSNLWKEVGWGTILYLAAIAGIDQTIYEAATVDGAGKWKQMLHVTLPNLLPVMGITLTLSMASVLSAGYDQIYLLQTRQTYAVSTVIDTYVMEVGLQGGQYGYASAVSLFQGVIGLIMIVVFNKAAKKFFSISLW